VRFVLTPGGKLFLGVLLVYSVCPPFRSFDSYYVVPTTLSLIERGTTAVDPYVSGGPEAARYAVECVPPSGPAVGFDQAKGCAGGHWYDYFSIGVPVVATPLVLVLGFAVKLLHMVVPALPGLAGQSVVGSFLAGDFVRGVAVVELLCAAVFGAAAVWLQYRIARRFLAVRPAIWLALLFAFGTAEWANGSRNLSQHGLSILCLSAAVYLLLSAEEAPARLVLAAMPLAVSFTIRPSNCIAVAAITLYVALHHRRRLLPFLACAAPVALLFFAHNVWALHSIFPRYYNVRSPEQHPALDGFLMNLVSPSRGLLVFTPVVLFSAAGMVLAVHRRWCSPLVAYLAAIVVLHALLICRYWGGHSYGPRYFSDMAPLFVFFLIPAILHWQKMAGAPRRAAAAVFLALAAWSVLVQFRGATSVAAQSWNVDPVNVDHAKWRVWDWRDPQFLRGLR
jgi:hypothetical protein